MSVQTDTVQSICPIDGSELGVYERTTGADLETRLDRAVAAQQAWRRLPIDERGQGLRALAVSLRSAQARLAETITLEMGKTLAEARAEIEKSALVCEYYADHGATQLAATEVPTQWAHSYVQYPPLGVVLAVMPWNYPVWQVMRAVAPALMAGNTVVLKHASNVVGSAMALAEVFAAAGVPDSLLEVIVVGASEVAELIADPRIAAVTLTGSEPAGISVATACARNLKKSVLELGGSDPFVVLADADLDAAAAAAVKGRFLNAGQSCIAAKRFVVVDAVADDFEAALVERVRGLVIDDPRREGVDLGPMARADLRDELLDQVRGGVQAGGRLICGGGDLGRSGAWLEPTVISGVEPGTPLASTETFGPVAAILRARDEREAISIANDSPYGLSSSIWSRDVDRVRALADEIEAGAVFVNSFSASDPRMPFGGIKRSGWGRELGAFGIREFVNIQAVTVSGG